MVRAIVRVIVSHGHTILTLLHKKSLKDSHWNTSEIKAYENLTSSSHGFRRTYRDKRNHCITTSRIGRVKIPRNRTDVWRAFINVARSGGLDIFERLCADKNGGCVRAREGGALFNPV